MLVGVTSFNNSWRATGEASGADRGKLIMGERCIDKSIDLIAKTDLRIAVFHHPIDWLAEFESSCVSPRLFNGFDILAYGHVHSVQPELRVSPSGSSIVSQSGSYLPDVTILTDIKFLR